MTDKDKLIQISREVHRVCYYNGCNLGCKFRNLKPDCINYAIAECMLAEGVIVPHCRVGDTVYEIQPTRNRVQEYKITRIVYDGNSWTYYWVLKDGKGIYGNLNGFVDWELGKTVFLSKKEAKQALKERVNNA